MKTNIFLLLSFLIAGPMMAMEHSKPASPSSKPSEAVSFSELPFEIWEHILSYTVEKKKMNEEDEDIASPIKSPSSPYHTPSPAKSRPLNPPSAPTKNKNKVLPERHVKRAKTRETIKNLCQVSKGIKAVCDIPRLNEAWAKAFPKIPTSFAYCADTLRTAVINLDDEKVKETLYTHGKHCTPALLEKFLLETNKRLADAKALSDLAQRPTKRKRALIYEFNELTNVSNTQKLSAIKTMLENHMKNSSAKQSE